MDLVSDRGRRITVDELNTTQLLSHARKEAVKQAAQSRLSRWKAEATSSPRSTSSSGPKNNWPRSGRRNRRR